MDPLGLKFVIVAIEADRGWSKQLHLMAELLGCTSREVPYDRNAALEAGETVLVVISRHSTSTVPAILEAAWLKGNYRVIPIKTDDSSAPALLAGIKPLDLSRVQGDNFVALFQQFAAPLIQLATGQRLKPENVPYPYL